jgi:outer membrane protein OmpA-like peptidoglycan-associated protein
MTHILRYINKNRSIKLVLLLVLFFLSSAGIYSQTTYNRLVDTAELYKAEFINLKGINTPYLEFSPAFYEQGLVFVSSLPQTKKRIVDKNIGEHFFSLKYAEIDSYGNLEKLSEFPEGIRLNYHAGPVAFSSDNNLMFLSRNTADTRIRKNEKHDVKPIGIFIYGKTDGNWVLDSELPVNSYGYMVMHPTWDEENSRLIFASDMPGGYGGTDLYSIIKTENGWQNLKNLGPEINTDYNESFPFIYRSQFLFFASNKDGGLGGIDMYFSYEDNGQFLTPVNLGDRFNSEYDDFSLIISDDPSVCYFSSSRPGGSGKDDIYMIRSERPIFRMFHDYYTIIAQEKNSGNPLSDVKITFSSFEIDKSEKPRVSKSPVNEIIYQLDPSKARESKPILTDANGKYNIVLSSGSFIITAVKPGYQPHSSVYVTDKFNTIIEIEMELEIIDTFHFSFLDSDNKSPITDVSFEITDGRAAELGKKDNVTYYLNIVRGNSVAIKTPDDEYLSKELTIQYPSTPAIFDILLEKKVKYVVQMPVAIGEKFVLKDIFYAYNSSELDKRAKSELDRLADHLLKNPKLRIELSSHTDSRGNDEYNQLLSEERSMSAYNYLIKKGIDKNRIIPQGYGETMLRNHCINNVNCSEAEHAENRRTEIRVIE